MPPGVALKHGLPRMKPEHKLSKEELNRYNRQIRLPEIGTAGQQRIKNSSVLVIGAGALGCGVLQHLAIAGIGTIGIIDNDWVDESNLHRQVLYTDKDIGRPKPLVAKERVEILNPYLSCNAYFQRLNKKSALEILTPYDIIVDCTDNVATRYLISDAAVILNKPVVYGEILRFTGQITVLNYNNGPTLRCICPDMPHALDMPTCAETGIIGSVAGIIGAMQATEVIKIILKKDGVLSGVFFSIDTLNFSTYTTSYTRDEDAAKISELGEYDDICLSNTTNVPIITREQLKQMLEEPTSGHFNIIDLREPAEITDLGFKTISIPFYNISENIPALLTMDSIVFYCKYGIRSTYVVNYLSTVYQKEKLYSLEL